LAFRFGGDFGSINGRDCRVIVPVHKHLPCSNDEIWPVPVGILPVEFSQIFRKSCFFAFAVDGFIKQRINDLRKVFSIILLIVRCHSGVQFCQVFSYSGMNASPFFLGHGLESEFRPYTATGGKSRVQLDALDFQAPVPWNRIGEQLSGEPRMLEVGIYHQHSVKRFVLSQPHLPPNGMSPWLRMRQYFTSRFRFTYARMACGLPAPRASVVSKPSPVLGLKAFSQRRFWVSTATSGRLKQPSIVPKLKPSGTLMGTFLKGASGSKRRPHKLLRSGNQSSSLVRIASFFLQIVRCESTCENRQPV
jgi:hypothetical protein